MRERIGYYDIARGLGIIFVVIGHIDTFYMPFRSYVISFHMALFLIISGMLIRETGEDERSFRVAAGKKVCRILIPYFLFSVLSVTIEGLRLLAEGVFYWPHLRSLLITTLTLQGNSVMWFLPALFFSELFFMALRKLAFLICRGRKNRVENTGKDSYNDGTPGGNPQTDAEKCGSRKWKFVLSDILTVMLVLLLVGLVVWSNIFELSFYAGRADIEKYKRLHEVLSMLIRSSVCTFFVCFGFFVRKYIMSRKVPAYAWGGTAVLLLGVCAVMNHINPGVDLRALDWGDSDIYVKSFYITLCVKAAMYLAGAAAGAMGIIFLCRALEKCSRYMPFKILMFFGANSLIIMATHLDFHVLHVSMDLTGFLNQYIDSSFFYHTCLLVFVFAIEAVMIRIINRYIPVLAGRYKKKKEFS